MNSTKIDELMSLVLQHIIADASRPPQIVEIPEQEFLESPITLILNKNTTDLLDGLSKQFGTSRERIARSLLHAVAAFVDN